MKYEQEVKRILRGYSTRIQGFYVAAESLQDVQYFGSYNGADALRTWGLYCLQRRYLMPKKIKPTLEKCVQQLYRIGNPALLRENEDTACCLRMRAMGNPVFLVLEVQEKILYLYVYTARALFCRRVCKKMISLFESDLKEEITPAEEAVEVKKDKITRREKREKKIEEKLRKELGKSDIKEDKSRRKEEERKLKLRRKEEKYQLKRERRIDRLEEKELVRQIREVRREQLQEERPIYKPAATSTKVPVIEGLDNEDDNLDIEEYLENYVRENH